MSKQNITLTKEQVEAWKQVYGIKDAQYGGLVLGNRHLKGKVDSGVKALNPINGNLFNAVEMEGGEYLMCAKATQKHKKRLDEINRYTGKYDEISEERISNLFSVIKPSSAMEMLMLSGSDHYIINRSATSKFLEELDKMNRECIIESLTK